MVALCGAGARLERFRLKARIIAASFGLVTCSAVLVDLWGGITEAHFHFFVMIGVLTLYQDWTPFLVAIVFVVVHHGVGGMLDPRAVFGDNPEAHQAPLVVGLHSRWVRARRQRRPHRRVAHQREPAAARPAHRSAQPVALPKQLEARTRTAGARHGPLGWRCCSATSTASR